LQGFPHITQRSSGTVIYSLPINPDKDRLLTADPYGLLKICRVRTFMLLITPDYAIAI
jgi:hypothetical protein